MTAPGYVLRESASAIVTLDNLREVAAEMAPSQANTATLILLLADVVDRLKALEAPKITTPVQS